METGVKLFYYTHGRAGLCLSVQFREKHRLESQKVQQENLEALSLVFTGLSLTTDAKMKHKGAEDLQGQNREQTYIPNNTATSCIFEKLE